MTVTLNSSTVQQNFGQAMERALRSEDVVVERYGVPPAGRQLSPPLLTAIRYGLCSTAVCCCAI